jgi:hypothetical protein
MDDACHPDDAGRFPLRTVRSPTRYGVALDRVERLGTAPAWLDRLAADTRPHASRGRGASASGAPRLWRRRRR